MKFVHNNNYLWLLIKFGVVLVILVLISDFAGQWYLGAEPYQKTKTSLSLLSLQTHLRIFSHKATFAAQEFYLPAASVIDSHSRSYARLGKLIRFSNNEALDQHEVTCRDQCRLLFMQLNWRTWLKDDPYDLARRFYVAGLESYEGGDAASSLYFLELSRRIAPDWSYYHLEVANLLAYEGLLSRGRQVLAECQQFDDARAHCQIMADDDFWLGQVPVGFLSEVIHMRGDVTEVQP